MKMPALNISSILINMLIIFFISIVSFILALVHFVIFKVAVSIFSLSGAGKLVIGIILTILCLSFILASILSSYFDNSFSRIFYKASAIWLGLATYLFLASCFYVLLTQIFKLFSIGTSMEWLGILFFVLAIITSVYGVIHARSLVIKNIDVTLPNLPTSWQGKRAVWISDIHLGAIYDEDFLKNIVVKINEINPDIVFIGGDLYDGTKVDTVEIIKPLADLHPTLGKYFITGNHEEFRNNTTYLEAVRSVGVRALNNEIVNVNDLQLIGVDDRDSINTEKFKSILANLNINKNKTSILLKHQPFQLAEAEKAGVSFQISGHTHRAQMFPLNIFTNLIYKGYDYGLKRYNNMAVYTSSGVGTWGPPLRVGSDSEIVIFNFK